MVGGSADRPGSLAEFLSTRHPHLAREIADQIQRRLHLLEQHPLIGRPIKGRPEFRELTLRVFGATYVFRYALYEDRLVLLRAFHGREDRG